MSSAMFLTKTLRTSFLSFAFSRLGSSEDRLMPALPANMELRELTMLAGAEIICVCGVL